jgi:CRP-like cAMP-binding protein
MAAENHELSLELERMASSVSMPSGTILFRCGDPVSGVFVIRSGVVSMFMDSSTEVFVAKTLGPGEIAGLPAALTGTYSLSAQVSEDAELGFIPAVRVAALLERSPNLCLIAARAMSDEIARMRSRLRDGLMTH